MPEGFDRRSRGLLRRFRRNADGAVAIEFAFVALPFFGLLFAILETALMLWSSQVLEKAVGDAARQIYTGQFQSANAGQNLTPAQLADRFRNAVCDNVARSADGRPAKALFDCQGLLRVDVASFTSFPDATVPPPITNGAFDPSNFAYRPTQPNEIVVVRAAMEYPVYTAFPAGGQANLTNGKRLMMGSATFRNEPFPTNPNPAN